MKLPEYKHTFPSWPPTKLSSIVRMDPQGLDLLEKMLVYEPVDRISARKSLSHPFIAGAPLVKPPLINFKIPDQPNNCQCSGHLQLQQQQQLSHQPLMQIHPGINQHQPQPVASYAQQIPRHHYGPRPGL